MWILKSFIYPAFSPSFYKEAVHRGIKKGLLIFVLFIFLVTLFSSVRFLITAGVGLNGFITEIKNSDISEEIAIENGTLYIEGLDDPIEYSEGGQYFAIDLTGKLKEIPEGYNEGILVLKKQIIIRSEDNYGDLEVTYLDLFNNEDISITKADLVHFLKNLTLGILVIAPFVILLLTVVIQTIILSVITVIGAVVLSLAQKQNPFRKAFLITIYAAIPVFYVDAITGVLNSLINYVSGINIFGLVCFIPWVITLSSWLLFWGIGYYGLEKKAK